MAATTQKTKPNGQVKPATPSSAGEITAEDRQLLKFVRMNAQPIIAALTRTASDAGGGRNWNGMTEGLQIAHQLSKLCPPPVEATPATMTQAASA